MKITSTLLLLTFCCLGQPLFAQSEAEQEVRELFRRVEKRLAAIDELLSDASSNSGNAPSLESAAPSGIDELLKLSREGSQQVIDAIDRILEISAAQPPPPGGGSGGGEEPSAQPGSGQSGGSPLDRGPQTTPREQTPEAGEQPGGEKPGGEKPGNEQGEPKKPGPKPKDGPASPDDNPQNLQLGKGNAAAPGSPSSADGLERWGALPQHAQNVFRSEGGTELPAQYRDWIDSYHRRLNKESGR